MLDVRLAKRRGQFDLDIAFSAPARSTTVLIGESGAGKTSVLRLLAGLDQPDQGHVTVDGTVFADTTAGIAVPSWCRDIGYVSQDYALFPHLSVYENVAFGLRSAGCPRRAIRPQVEEALQLAGVIELGRRMPGQLSGGQQQRTALARALALRPRVLLLDEPLSALDLQTRRVVRTELRRLLRTLPCTTVYVTHSAVEALVFGDQLIVLDQGRIVQTGSRDDLLRYPRSRLVAELMGTNLITARAMPSTPDAPRVRVGDRELEIVAAPATGDVFVTVSPNAIMLFRERPASSAQNVFAGPVVEIVPEPPAGDRVRVVLGTTPMLVAEVTREAVADLELADGVWVYATFKATGIQMYA